MNKLKGYKFIKNKIKMTPSLDTGCWVRGVTSLTYMKAEKNKETSKAVNYDIEDTKTKFKCITSTIIIC